MSVRLFLLGSIAAMTMGQSGLSKETTRQAEEAKEESRGTSRRFARSALAQITIAIVLATLLWSALLLWVLLRF
jgi:hypothetical protein